MVLPGIWRQVGYQPTETQLRAHLSGARFVLVAGGERAGKSYFSAMELLLHCDVPEGLFWIVGPDYEQTRTEFTYVMEALERIGALESRPMMPRRGPWQLQTKWGAQIETKTSQEIMRLASKAPDGILMVEAAQQEYLAWLKCRGRVVEKRGWVIMSGTFEGSLGWFPEVWARWQAPNTEDGRSFSLPTWSNLAVFPQGRDDPEILALEALFSPDLFQERFGAIPCKPEGLVHKEFEYARHVVEWATFDPALSVHLAIDPGFATAYAVIALQVAGDTVMAIDEIYESGYTTADMILAAEQRPWWGNVVGGVIDVAGRQHQAQASHVEIWQQRGGVHLAANPVPVPDGIERLRTFLVDPETKEPRIFFNPSLTQLFREFGKYRYPRTRETQAERDMPIDRHNHAIKAISYFLYHWYGPVHRDLPAPRSGGAPQRARRVQGADLLFNRSGNTPLYTSIRQRPRPRRSTFR